MKSEEITFGCVSQTRKNKSKTKKLIKLENQALKGTITDLSPHLAKSKQTQVSQSLIIP